MSVDDTDDSTTMSEKLLNKYVWLLEIFTNSVRHISSKNSNENINHTSLHWKVINSYHSLTSKLA